MEYSAIQNRIIEIARQEANGVNSEQARDSGNIGEFGNVLSSMVDDVGHLQREAKEIIADLVQPDEAKGSTVAAKMKDADSAYHLMMQIRHKLVDVYSKVERTNAPPDS